MSRAFGPARQPPPDPAPTPLEEPEDAPVEGRSALAPRPTAEPRAGWRDPWMLACALGCLTLGAALGATGRLGAPDGGRGAAAKPPAARADSARADSARADSARADSARADSARADPAKHPAARADSARADSARADPAKPPAARADSARADSARADSARADSARADPAKPPAARADSARADSARARPSSRPRPAAKADRAEAGRTRPRRRPRPAAGAARVLVQRPLGRAGHRVQLWRLADGRRRLRRRLPSGRTRPLACGALTGAWGLWVTDVNGDRRPDLVIALRKRARYDPVVENRPHVYTLVGDRCVPLWRGTRLAGRFEQLHARGPQLWALERVGHGQRRVARYRWRGFGYAVERVLWQGRRVPRRWTRFFKKHRR